MHERLSYKGMQADIEYTDDDRAEATIDGRRFTFSRHAANLPMWACDDAYFVSDDLHEVLRHLIDYWYIITDPNKAPFEGPSHAELPKRPGGAVPAHGHEGHGRLDDANPGESSPQRGSRRGGR